jgi:hypothetical protein
MAERAVGGAIAPLGRRAPPIMTYFKPGRGASILRPDTRLWDGSLSRIAAIKLAWHNRVQPTALTHECGHLVAGIVGWNDAFVRLLRTRLGEFDAPVAEQVAAWASEIAADSFAFACTGFAAVATLADVVSGRGPQVFHFVPWDPHRSAICGSCSGSEMCALAGWGRGTTRCRVAGRALLSETAPSPASSSRPFRCCRQSLMPRC